MQKSERSTRPRTILSPWARAANLATLSWLSESYARSKPMISLSSTTMARIIPNCQLSRCRKWELNMATFSIAMSHVTWETFARWSSSCLSSPLSSWLQTNRSSGKRRRTSLKHSTSLHPSTCRPSSTRPHGVPSRPQSRSSKFSSGKARTTQLRPSSLTIHRSGTLKQTHTYTISKAAWRSLQSRTSNSSPKQMESVGLLWQISFCSLERMAKIASSWTSSSPSQCSRHLV